MKRTDIDALARLLDGDVAETTVSGDARALAALAVALESSAAPPHTHASASTAGAPHAIATLPRPDFRNELRATLIEAARAQTANPPILTRLRQTVDDTTTRWRYSTRVAAATGATAFALSSGGVAVASQQALPNDALYGIRLTLEDVRLLLISDPVARAEQRLAYATERIDDAEAVAQEGDFAAAAKALEEADATARLAAGELISVAQERQDPKVLDSLEVWTDEQRTRLDDLGPILGGEASVSLDSVIVALSRISSRLTVLGDCSACASIDGFNVIPAAGEPFTACPCTEAPDKAAKPATAGAQPGTGDTANATTKPRKADRSTADSGDDGDNATQGSGTTDGGTTDSGGSTAPSDGDGDGDGGGDGGVSLPSDDTSVPTSGGGETEPDPDDDVTKTVDDVIGEVTKPKPNPSPDATIDGSNVVEDTVTDPELQLP